ncbi:MAG: PcfJ domain-containing protein [bacterium]|nr:PcfJ domain-containing protein [bacterium]
MTTLLMDQTDLVEDIQEHFQTLNVDSIVAYKLWCYRHGFSKDLDKTPEQRQAEIDLIESQEQQRDPDISKYHNPRRAEYMARIFKGELQNDTLSDVLFRIRAMYNQLDGDPGAQQALGRLILHVDKYGDLMRPAQASKSYGSITANTHLAGLGQLARHQKDWIRPLEDWRPESGKPREQFHTLVRHLLAKYNVPAFFNNAFFQGSTPESHAQQEWFKHIGMGQNIRTAGIPMRITKRMAHLILQERGHRPTIYQTLRKVQFEAFSGDRRGGWTIGRGPLSERLENEDFWETVVQFLANQTFLERSYINPIIDYIRNQKFTPQRIPQPDETEIEGPPLHPNFCMKGRSINKLIRQVDTWHEELTGLEDVAFESWNPSGFREYEHTVLDPELKRNVQWTVHEMLTSQQLHAEGRIMHHCVGSYAKRCVAGEQCIWSLRALDLDAAEENQIQEHVLTIAVNTKKKAVVQHAGKYNLKPFGKKHLAKERQTGNIYVHLLRQAPTYMRMWMDREGLSFA